LGGYEKTWGQKAIKILFNETQMSRLSIPHYEGVEGVTGVWLVGGSVRDYLIDQPHKDLDYAVESESYDCMRAWLDGLGVILVESPQYYTIKAKIPFNHPARSQVCDFVMCRKDGPYSDKRRPDHTIPGTLDDDLARRDFTVNAIAVGPDDAIYDPLGGREDLERMVLRTVRADSYQCFSEDPLRLLRAMRFTLVKGFTLSPEIETCLEDSKLGVLLQNHVHVERKREELAKCFKHDTVGTMIWLTQHPVLLVACFDAGMWLEPTCKKIKRLKR
jgi:tRNA nucleotidyltransferase (CCA-adding enzyme)